MIQLSIFWLKVQETFKNTCEKFDSKWQKRKRILNTQLLVAFILKLVESKNKQGYGSKLAEFWESCLDKGITLPQVSAISSSSLCEARQKFPEEVFVELNQELLSIWNQEQNLPNFKGYRLFAVDGSKINLPRELIDEGFKVYDKERGPYYPQGLLSCLYNLQEKVIYDFNFVSHMNERLCAIEHMKILSSNDIMIFDRGYFSYLLFYLSLEYGIHVIFRMQKGSTNEKIEEFWNGNENDKIIEYSASKTVKYDLKKAGYDLDFKPLRMRLIKHKIGDQEYVYATSLMDEVKFPAACFGEIYHGRWGIEEFYKISKKFVEIEDFHSKMGRGVRQELYAHVLLINLCRFIEFAAQDLIPPSQGKKKKEGKEYQHGMFDPISMIKVNFKNCLIVVGRSLEMLILKSSIVIEDWLKRIMSSIARVRQKIRPGRSYERISRKPSNKWTRAGPKKYAQA